MNIEEKILQIRKLIEESKNPVIFFDNDSDGTMSYFQLKNFNSKLKGYPFRKVKDEQIELAQRVGKKNDLVLFFDTPQIEEEVFELIKDKTIIWVDHHRGNSQELIEKYTITHLNPLNYDEKDTRPSCYWAYKITNMKENLPLVSVGSLADFYLLECIVELNENNTSLFNLLFNIPEKQELLDFLKELNGAHQQTKPVVKWIVYLSYNSTAGVLKMFFDFIYKLDSYKIQDVVKSLEKKPLTEIIAEIHAGKNYPFDEFALFRKQQKELLKKALKQNEGKKVAYFEHTGDTSFNRQIIEESLYRLNEVEIMFSAYMKEDSDIVSCSFRSKNISVETILKEQLKNVEGKGGGHHLACGAIVSKKDFPRFKKNFLQQAKEEVNSIQHH